MRARSSPSSSVGVGDTRLPGSTVDPARGAASLEHAATCSEASNNKTKETPPWRDDAGSRVPLMPRILAPLRSLDDDRCERGRTRAVEGEVVAGARDRDRRAG